MAYATISHVEARVPARGAFTQSTKPNKAQVTEYLNDVAATIDLALGIGGYDAPVPMGTSSVASSVQQFLQHTNAVGAAYMSERAAPVTDKANELEEMYETALKMIRTSGLQALSQGDRIRPRTNVLATPAFFSRDMVL